MAVSITKRKTKSGSIRYRAQVRVFGHQHASKTFSRKRAAQDWGRREEDRLRSIAPGSAQNHTVTDAIKRYRKEALPKLRSRDVRQGHLDWWEEKIGHFKLSDIQPAHIADCVGLLEDHEPEDKPRAGATINRYHSSIGAVFNQAHKKWHWMPSNPSRDVLRYEESKGRVRWLSDVERKSLLESCQESGWSGLYPLVLLALATGARQGELLGLTWDRVDLKGGTAYLETTKSGDHRTLPIRGPALEELRNYAKVRRMDSVFVFPSVNGRKPYSFRPYWNRAVRRAEIKDFRFHDLRHTTASYLAMNGASLIEIADVLGHKTLEMVKRYAHLSDSHKADVLERMNASVFGSSV